MLAKTIYQGEITIIGYDEKTIHSTKTGKNYRVLEIYYNRLRDSKDPDRHQYGSKAESFTYFMKDDETWDECDITDILEPIHDEQKLVICEVSGTWQNYKLNPSELKILTIV